MLFRLNSIHAAPSMSIKLFLFEQSTFINLWFDLADSPLQTSSYPA